MILQSEIDLVEKFSHKWWQKLHKLDDELPTLYHYTKIDILSGILGKHEFWATNIKYVNDYSEIQHGLAFAQDQAEFLLKEHHTPNEEIFLKTVLRLGPALNDIDLYVISLSESRDLLSQWRGYGEKYRSVSIGLNPSLFNIHRANNPFETAYLHKVKYDRDEFAKAIFEYLYEYLAVLAKISTEAALADMPLKIHGLIELLATIKDPSWSEEREWRVILRKEQTIHPEITLRTRHYRPSEKFLIPYVKIKLFDAVDTLKEIIIPNSNHFEISKNSILQFLADSGYDARPDIVNHSSIPIVH